MDPATLTLVIHCIYATHLGGMDWYKIAVPRETFTSYNICDARRWELTKKEIHKVHPNKICWLHECKNAEQLKEISDQWQLED